MSCVSCILPHLILIASVEVTSNFHSDFLNEGIVVQKELLISQDLTARKRCSQTADPGNLISLSISLLYAIFKGKLSGSETLGEY